MKYDLSIIVPIYNIDRYLEEAIESLINQPDYSYEIILVNDGSTDSCFSICNRYQKNSRIKIVNKENGGLVSARKAGLVISEGKYITFLDGDDWIDRNYYYNMLKKAKECDADVICSSYTEYENGKYNICINSLESGMYNREKLDIICESIIYRNPYYTFGIVPSVCTKIFKREYMVKYLLNIPDMITIGEDGACTFPILFECKKIVVMNENAGYYYRKFSGSMMNSYSWKRVEQILNAARYIDGAIKSEKEIYAVQKMMYFSTFIKYAVKGEAMSSGKMQEKVKRLDYLCKDEIMFKTLRNMNDIAIQYRVMFWLLKKRRYHLAIYYYKFYDKFSYIFK